MSKDERDRREAGLRAWFESEKAAHPASTLGDRMQAVLDATDPLFVAAMTPVPRVITTVEELGRYYEGDVFKDARGEVWCLDGATGGFYCASEGRDETYADADVPLPLTVLTPGPDTAALVAELRGLHVREVVAVHESHGEEAWCPRCQQHWPCDESAILDRYEVKGGA